MKILYEDFYTFSKIITDSTCHLSILKINEKIMIVCSQLPYNHGTSVINGFENIYEGAKNKIIKNSHKKDIKKYMTEFLAKLEQEETHTNNLANFLKGSATYVSFKYFLHLWEQFKTTQITWIEHWPVYHKMYDVQTNKYRIVYNIDGTHPEWGADLTYDDIEDQLNIPKTYLKAIENKIENS